MKKKDILQLIVICVVIIGTLVFLSLRGKESESKERIWIARPESETEKQEILLTIGEKEEEWLLSVEPRKKTEQETEQAFAETIRMLNERFGIMDGEQCMITQSLVLPQYIAETDVEIRWESSDDSVVSKDGKVERRYLAEPSEVQLKARLRFAEEEREYWFSIVVPPYEEKSNEAMFYEAQESLELLERETADEGGFYLPETIGSVGVGLPKESNSLPAILAVLILFLPFAVVLSKRQEKEKEKRRRQEALTAAYPQLITKLSLYTGAGLSLRGAWERLAAEYRTGAGKGKKDAIGEELLILTGELKNGVSEAKAYEDFGKRIALKPYLRCASLMISQLQKGSGGLRKGLETEVQLAWEMHREYAARKGEEAQTKMLFPMMGMLFLVMAVIMIPAFFSM